MQKKIIIKLEDCSAHTTGGRPQNIKKLDHEIASYMEKFMQNLAAAHRDYISVPCISAAFAAQAPTWRKQYLNPGGTHMNFSMTAPVLYDFMKSCASPKLRQEIYDRYRTPRRAGVPISNITLGEKLIKLRQKKAKTLGYANYLDYVAADNTVKAGTLIREFMAQSQKYLTEIYHKNYQLLARYAEDCLALKKMRPADALYVLNHWATAPSPAGTKTFEDYFPARPVTEYLISYVEKIFGLEFIPAAAAPEQYRVRDKQTATDLGRVTFDLWAPAEKSANFSEVTEVVYETSASSTANLKLPEIKITCDFQKTSTGRRLLNFSDLISLFHEMGHVVETLFTLRNERETGHLAQENDLVEFYSMFMENFIYDEGFVRTMSAGLGTGDKLPQKQYRAAREMYKFINSFQYMEILEHSLKAIKFYEDDPAPILAREKKVQNALYGKNQIFSTNSFYDQTAQIFAHDPELESYSGNYYTYLLSEIWARKIFKNFKEKNKNLRPQNAGDLRGKIYSQRGRRSILQASCDYLGIETLKLELPLEYHVQALTDLPNFRPAASQKSHTPGNRPGHLDNAR